MRRGKKNAPKNMRRENDSRTEHKASNRSSDFLKIDPVGSGVGDAITLTLETVQTPAREAVFDDSFVLRALG